MSHKPARPRIETEDVGDVTVVGLVHRRILDEEGIQRTGEELFRVVDELGRQKLLLDFGNVEFMSSAALGKLITLHRKLQAVQGKLVLCKIAPDIRELFQIIRLDRFFTIVTGSADTDEIIGTAFGNPFRTVAFSPDWQTDTALALARQIDEEHEFSAMPILADALQDAGCGDEALLAYFRDPALPPTRARWLIDLVLARA